MSNRAGTLKWGEFRSHARHVTFESKEFGYHWAFSFFDVDLRSLRPCDAEQQLERLVELFSRDERLFYIAARRNFMAGEYPATRIAYHNREAGSWLSVQLSFVATAERGYILEVVTRNGAWNNFEVCKFFDSLQVK